MKSICVYLCAEVLKVQSNYFMSACHRRMSRSQGFSRLCNAKQLRRVLSVFRKSFTRPKAKDLSVKEMMREVVGQRFHLPTERHICRGNQKSGLSWSVFYIMRLPASTGFFFFYHPEPSSRSMFLIPFESEAWMELQKVKEGFTRRLVICSFIKETSYFMRTDVQSKNISPVGGIFSKRYQNLTWKLTDDKKSSKNKQSASFKRKAMFYNFRT